MFDKYDKNISEPRPSYLPPKRKDRLVYQHCRDRSHGTHDLCSLFCGDGLWTTDYFAWYANRLFLYRLFLAEIAWTQCARDPLQCNIYDKLYLH